MVRIDPPLPSDDHRPFDHIPQLSHISWPGVRLEAASCTVPDPFDIHLVFFTELPDEMLGQERDIIGPLPERRDLELEDIESVVEILTEVSIPFSIGWVTVRRSEDSVMSGSLQDIPGTGLSVR